MQNSTRPLPSLPLFALAQCVLTKLVRAATKPQPLALAPLEQQKLTINNYAEVTSLDPQQAFDHATHRILRNLYEGLVRLDPEGRVVPGVARSWSLSHDGKTWTFILRFNARWSNGERCTADDFVSAWRRLADPHSGVARIDALRQLQLFNSEAVFSHTAPLETLGVTAISDRELQLQLAQPCPYLLQLLAHPLYAPLHRPSLLQWGSQWAKPDHLISNGAYRLHHYAVHDKLVLRRNFHYWDNPHTVIEEATFLAINDTRIDVTHYQTGILDITRDLPAETFSLWQKEHPLELYTFHSWAVRGLCCNTVTPPFNDPHVRLALSMAIDRERIVTQITQKGERPAYSLNPPAMGGFHPPLPEWHRWPLKKRYQQARELLQQAGYTQQNPLQFTLLYSQGALNHKTAIALHTLWKKHLNVHITLQPCEWKGYLSRLFQGEFQMAYSCLQAAYGEPSALLNRFLSYANYQYNSTRYSSSLFDLALKQARYAQDLHARYCYYQQAEQLLAQDAPFIPFYHSIDVRLVKPWIIGLTPHNPLDTFALQDLYIQQLQ